MTELYEDVDDTFDDAEGDCPACYHGYLTEIRDVDKRGEEFIKLFCRECGYEE